MTKMVFAICLINAALWASSIYLSYKAYDRGRYDGIRDLANGIRDDAKKCNGECLEYELKVYGGTVLMSGLRFKAEPPKSFRLWPAQGDE